MTSEKLRLAIGPGYLFLCLLLGGSAQGAWGNALLQLLAVLIIALYEVDPGRAPWPSIARPLLWFAGAIVLLVVLQTLPLPPELWSGLPGREIVLQGREVLGLPPGWAPVSLAPYTTFSNLLFLLPPVAIVVAVVNTRAEGTLWFAVALIAATFAGVLLGLLQVGSGNPIASPWYLYRFSNFGFATGFFANSNHMASLLLVALPFIFALGLTASARVKKDPRKRYSILGLTVAGAGVAAIGIAMNGSLAGAGLLLPVAVASLLLLVRPSARVAWAIGGLGVVAVAAFLALLSSPIGERLAMSGASTSMSTRQDILAHSVDALKEFNWVGSGIGTYAEIYPLFEDPDAIGPTYVNHAHSDYIEIAVETGVAGILLLALFLGWWLMTLRRTVTAPNASLFARAGLIGSAAILLHSLVDYPLRTSALSTAFAFCLAVMLLSRDSARSSKDLREARHLVIE